MPNLFKSAFVFRALRKKRKADEKLGNQSTAIEKTGSEAQIPVNSTRFLRHGMSAAGIIGICHRKNATAACNGAKGSVYYLKKIVFKELPLPMIFDRFFSPYAEYRLRTTFSEVELKNALNKELPGYFLASVKAVFGKEEVSFCRTGKPLVLHPVLRGRNSLRGEIRIQCRKTETDAETALDVTIKPQNLEWMVWIISIFAVTMTVLLLCAGTWMAVAPLIVIGFQFAVLAACRSIGESEVPEIQRAFEETLRQQEKKYKAQKKHHAEKTNSDMGS